MSNQKIQLKKSQKTYSQYVSSGVEWIGDVPKGWGVKRLKYLTNINKNTLGENTMPDYFLKYLDISNVNKGVVNNPVEMIFDDAPSRARRIVKNDDVVLGTVRTYLQSVAHFENPDKNLIVSTGFAVLSSLKEIDSKFLYYQLLSDDFTHRLVAHSTGVSYPAITPKDLSDLEIFYPSKPEQQKIASYLDKKIGNIEKIVAKKKEQVGLLKEKRASVISRAVTRGLNPSVELIDPPSVASAKGGSGVEWIGKVPKGWEVKKIKEITKIQIGWTPSTAVSEYFEGKNLWATIADMDRKVIIDTKNKISDKAIEYTQIKKVKKGSLLYSFKLSVGKVAFAGQDMYTNEAIVAFEPSKKINVRFLYYPFATYLINNANDNIYGAKLLNQGLIKNSYIALPPTEEQQKIADYLDEQNKKIDTLIQKIEQSIQLLQEYKTSLISSVVRGRVKIK